MTGKDLYALLDVRRDASPAELRRCYELALQRANRDGATRHMVDLVKAYEILSQPDRRRVYDETGLTVVPERVPNTYGRAVPWRGGHLGLGHLRTRGAPGRTVVPSMPPRRVSRATVAIAVMSVVMTTGAVVQYVRVQG